MDKQSTFAERCQLLRETAEQLKACANVVALEAICMTGAEKRFAELRGTTSRKASR
jgi:hypothetical protein